MKTKSTFLISMSVIVLAFISLSAFSYCKNSGKKETSLKQKETEGIEWLTIEEAYKRNQKHPRKIFIDVYTDWCGWCKVMEKNTFKAQEIIDYTNKNYYAVKLNAESERELTLAGKKTTEMAIARDFKVNSYPTIVFIHEDFQTVLPVPGYRDPKEFLNVLKQFKDTKAE